IEGKLWIMIVKVFERPTSPPEKNASPGVINITRLAARSMNPVFAPLNIVRPFDAAQHAERSRYSRDRIDTDYLTALVLRQPNPRGNSDARTASPGVRVGLHGCRV